MSALLESTYGIGLDPSEASSFGRLGAVAPSPSARNTGGFRAFFAYAKNESLRNPFRERLHTRGKRSVASFCKRSRVGTVRVSLVCDFP